METSRRTLLTAGLGLTLAPRLALARAETDQRFVFLLLRGGWDGLAVLSPTGEPAYAAARGKLAETPASAGEPQKLDGLFMLHPALAQAGALYRAGELAFIPAVASPYRERSHFDAQMVVESGGASPHAVETGWLNRLLPFVNGKAVAISPVIPLALRGPATATSYAPSRLPDATDSLMQRVTSLYADDPLLHPLWGQALAARRLAGDAGGPGNPQALAAMAAKFLAEPDGARIAMLEHDGWDTHAQQAQRLTNQLRQLDTMIATLKSGLGPHWANTTILVASEFGRTVAANGTGGTDHGTGGLALLVGGAVKGGRILGDWPGLASLHEGRDLRPTTDLRALMLAAVAGQFGLDANRAGAAIFPGASIRPTEGLFRS